MTLTLADAQRIVDGAVAKATDLDVKVSVAVTDVGGALIALSRMDGAFVASAAGAHGKAAASASFSRPSHEINGDSPIIQALIASLGGNILSGHGGLPVYDRSGFLVGAVGIGGANREQDKEIAAAGVAAY